MLMPLRRYAEFSGRSRRKEYWMFALLMMIVYAIGAALMFSAIVPMITAGAAAPDPAMFTPAFWVGAGLLGLFTLAIIVPGIAVTVRRLHDRDMSGWWYLGVVIIGQIPYLGGLVQLGFLVLMCLPGTPGPNRFGPDPKGGDSYEAFA
ncbi:MAG TPA: DUF805 domain-containing protein [Novosphingobium sp.]|nr:DUF805 domain-containing protein [Novosphingobium sp.]